MIRHVINLISIWAIPAFLVGIPLYGFARGVKVYESFVEGAKEGFQVGIRIVPYLVAILVAVGMLRGAGGIDLLAYWLDPFMRRIGMPAEILPLAIMRSLSGSGSMGIVTELVKTHGPDSFIDSLWEFRNNFLRSGSLFWLGRGKESTPRRGCGTNCRCGQYRCRCRHLPPRL
jgi:spore maturation protein B